MLSFLRPHPLHIGNPGRHAEFAPAHFGESSDAVADRFMRGIGETQPRSASAVVLVSRPFGARIDGDAGSQRRPEQFLRIDLIRQFDPEKNAAFRFLEFGRGAEPLMSASISVSSLARSARVSAGTWASKCRGQNSPSTICSSAPEPASVLSASIRANNGHGATM